MEHRNPKDSEDKGLMGGKNDEPKVVIVQIDHEKLTSVPDEDDTRLESSAPDGGFGWVVVSAVFIIHVIMDGITYSFGVLLPDLLMVFKGSTSGTAWVISVLIGTTYGSGPLPGILSNRFGRRPVAIVGGLLACLGTFLSSFAQEVWHLTALFGFLTGLGCGFVYLPAVVSVNHWFERRRAMAVGIAVCGSGIGMMVFAPLIDYLLLEYGVRGCLIILSGILLNFCVFAAVLRPTPSECKAERRSKLLTKNHRIDKQEMNQLLPVVVQDHALLPVERPSAQGFIGRLRDSPRCTREWLVRRLDMDLMRQWRFWIFCLTAFFGGMASYIPHIFLPNRAIIETKMDRDMAAYLISILGFSNLAGRLMSSAVSDQRWLNRIIVYCSCCLIAGLATSFSVYCTTYPMLVGYVLIYGFVGGFIIALQSVVLTDIVGLEKLTSAFGILLFIEGVAAYAGPPMAGGVVDYYSGTYSAMFIIFGIIMAMAGVSLLVIPTVDFFTRRSRGATKVVLSN